ncbi:hypothetical protein GCM10022384_04760 [Streptomyces marokkonensis]|uniref:Uncharacterized protein n=1 Tax=Streptomyces marokkonensis TaxID=324855 RepID=A0ABP7NUI2_9ACTN
MQGTAAAPAFAEWAAKAVPDAPATSVRAASIAVLLRVMSAGSFFRGGAGAVVPGRAPTGRGPPPNGMGVPWREIRNGPRARWDRPGDVRAGTPADDAWDRPRPRLKVLNTEGGAGDVA